MTVADDYQRECERVLLGLSWPIEDATEAAQALAADPGVRAAVEREARADELERAAEDLNCEGLSFKPGGWGSNPVDQQTIDVMVKAVQWLRDRAKTYRQEPSDGE